MGHRDDDIEGNIMNNQHNTKNVNQEANQDVKSKKPRKKKKIGCFGCFGILFLTIIITVLAIFAFNAIRKNIKEKENEKLEARFNYELKLSSEDKLHQAFEQGEISADTYILQLAYSIYDTEKLDPLYKSDNEFDFAPNISDLFMEHMDELSDETAEYVLKKMLVLDVKIAPDASQNSTADKEKWQPFSKNVLARGNDITVLDKAALSTNGKFLVWYTNTGKSAIEDKTIQKLANTIDDMVNDIGKFLDIDYTYNFDVYNSESYEDMKSVLQKCNIDENAIEEAFPIYIIEQPHMDKVLAWYTTELTFGYELAFKFGKILNRVMDFEDSLGERATVYSVPYIVVRPSSVSNMDNFNVILAHELTHHFQRIYYSDLNCSDHRAPAFTSETVANLVAASISKISDTETTLNVHANKYIKKFDNENFGMITNDVGGYRQFLWAKSYVDIVENGQQYLMESLFEKDPFNFLYKKAGDSYYLVLEDLAVRNITKDYDGKAFISTKYPSSKGEIDHYMDMKPEWILPNCFNYYYLDTKSYSETESVLYLTNKKDPRIFIKIMGRKKDDYSLIDTLYCNKDEKLILADFTGDDYKKYDEIIIALGNSDIKEEASYDLITISSVIEDFYDTLMGFKDLDPWEINGDCITIHVDDFVEGSIQITDYLDHSISHINTNIESDDKELIVDYTSNIQDEINRIGDGFKKFSDVFEYKTIRIYTIPVTDTVLSDEELHENAFDAISKPRIKLYNKIEDNMGITVGVSIHPFSETQLIFTVVITESEGEKHVYRIEVEK